MCKNFSLHSQVPLHDERDEDAVDDEHADEEDGLVQVVELDERRQRQDRHYPKVDQVLGGVITIFI